MISWGLVNVTRDTHTSVYSLQVTIKNYVKVGNYVKSAERRGGLPVFECEFLSQFPDKTTLDVPLGELPGHKDKITRAYERAEVRPRMRWAVAILT